MTKVVFSISMSLDGYIAGPDDAPGQGLGSGGDVLHTWTMDTTDVDQRFVEEVFSATGAMVVGRRTFDNSEEWGGEPPGGLPCVVLTHQPPPRWSGPGSPFTFVTEGIEAAVAAAREAAGDKDVAIGGGASTARQAIAAGLVDEMMITIVPVLLGGGVRIFDELPARLEILDTWPSPNATHVRYRVG
jgi:dihydrofolate reductase